MTDKTILYSVDVYKPSFKIVLQIDERLAKDLTEQEKRWINSHIEADILLVSDTVERVLGNLIYKRKNGESF